MVPLSDSLAEAREIVRTGRFPDDHSMRRLALRVTSRISGDRAVEFHERFFLVMAEVATVGFIHAGAAEAKGRALAFLDEIERASVAN